MFFTLIGQSDSSQVWGRMVGTTMAALLLIAPQAAFAQTVTNFETPPVLRVTDLVPEQLLQGKGFQVEEKVPTDGVMGTYTIKAEAKTFHEDAGTYQVRSCELLELRLSEIPAIVKLDEVSKTGVFAKSLAASAARPLESAGNMVLHPVGTVTGLPSGVGRLFDRVETGAGSLWNSATAPGESGLERTGDIAARTGTITRDALGYEQERRDLAKKLGVDPYTSNPILAKKLDEIAWVSFAARLAVSTAISVAVPGSMIITGLTTTDNLVWDTPRGDLIVRVETKLQEMNVPREQISAFSHNPAIPLSLQVAVVENLSRLAEVPGRGDVVVLMSSVMMESQARFLATSVRMLAAYHEKQKPITAVAAPGPLVGRDQEGALILPAPVDYVSWTERVAQFAQSSTLAAPQRSIWLTGKISPRASKEMTKLGWMLQDVGRLRPSQPSGR